MTRLKTLVAYSLLLILSGSLLACVAGRNVEGTRSTSRRGPSALSCYTTAREAYAAQLLQEGLSGVPAFFAPDEGYRATVDSIVSADTRTPQGIELVASDGSVRVFRRVARIHAHLPLDDGTSFTLSVFAPVLAFGQAVSSEELFIPFGDRSNGVRTYGGGRYLELPSTALELMGAGSTLDFNLALHPRCYHDERFVCPLPPPENLLNFAVPAGERVP